MDEIAPDRFLVHNPRAFGILKGEGQAEGRIFALTTWRRDGLLARLRERGIVVRTIAERITALPAPPPAPSIGALGWRAQTAAGERLSYFEPADLSWRPLEPTLRDDGAGIAFAEGWVVRRRKGRGPWSYFLTFRERGGGVGLRPLDETSALLTGYAQAAARGQPPWLLRRVTSGGSVPEVADPDVGQGVLLPSADLPPSYREVLALVTRPSPAGLVVESAHGWRLVQKLFGRLGVRLAIES
jgi:hypothetical protein